MKLQQKGTAYFITIALKCWRDKMSNTLLRGNLTLHFSFTRHRCWSLDLKVNCYCRIGSVTCIASVFVEQRPEPCSSLLPNCTETLATQAIGGVSSQFQEFSSLWLVTCFMNRPNNVRNARQRPRHIMYPEKLSMCGGAAFKSVLYKSILDGLRDE